MAIPRYLDVKSFQPFKMFKRFNMCSSKLFERFELFERLHASALRSL
jgi:hypothetical protein